MLFLEKALIRDYSDVEFHICDSARVNFTIYYSIQQICDFCGNIPVIVFIGVVVVCLLSVVVEGRQCRLKMK